MISAPCFPAFGAAVTMWVRKRLDLSWSDLAFAMRRVFRAGTTGGDEALVAEQFPASLVCLSVRSAFDLLLTALALPPGGEILMSAITVPDMPAIAARHGLRVVPLDLDPDSAAPSLAHLERAYSPRAQAIVVAHLFGSRCDLTPLVEFARERGLLLIEDAAQAFDGEYAGDGQADVSLFSFGPIKTATALGGGVAVVRDAELRQRMRTLQAAYPWQSRARFAQRAMKFAFLKTMSQRWPYGAFWRLCGALGLDADRWINGTVKNFPPGELLPRLRQRPCAALVALLARRLQHFDHRALARRTAVAERLHELLADAVPCPGAHCQPHAHWVFPIIAADPPTLIAALRAAGFDATQGQSLCVIPAPEDRPSLAPHAAQALLSGMVFLPLHAQMKGADLLRMAQVVRRWGAAPATLHQNVTTLPGSSRVPPRADPLLRCASARSAAAHHPRSPSRRR